MFPRRKFIVPLILAAVLMAGGSLPRLGAQGWDDFLTPEPAATADDPVRPDSPGETASPGSGDTLSAEPPSVPPPAGSAVFQKKWVETPSAVPRKFNDAQDFRDPFFLVRGFQDDSAELLDPGVTVDGLRFQAYGDTDKFVEGFYRQSNFSLGDVFGRIVYQESRQRCRTCHQGIEEISVNHRFECTKCHEGNPRARSRRSAHRNLVANPSSLEHAPKYCGTCHEEQIRKVTGSPMAANKGIINHTRYAWGARLPGDPAHSLRPAEHEVPLPPPGEGEAVDDFLRTRCLRCHLQGEAPRRPGDYRATGCAACHMIYANDGLSLSRDRAIRSLQKKELLTHENRFAMSFASNSLNNKRGYPVLHKFTVAIPSVQCRHCHNENGVGNEYEGLFGKPARPQPSRWKAGGSRPVLYGKEHEFLLPDIHRERGMHCIDCHGAEEFKRAADFPPPAGFSRIRCEDCHGTHAQSPEGFLLIGSDPDLKGLIAKNNVNPNLAKKLKAGDVVLKTAAGTRLLHVKREKKQWALYSKVTGKRHVVPLLKGLKPPPAHEVAGHMRSLECAACHARWSAGEWGLHVLREDRARTGPWQDWFFSDPGLQQRLFDARPADEKAADGMLDWVTARPEKDGLRGARLPGFWWSVVSEAGWDTLVLGKNRRGKYTILQPRYQYFLTQGEGGGPSGKRDGIPVTRDGRPGLLWVPHTPHTIRKTPRPCESCHENSLAAGLGDARLEQVIEAETFFRELGSKGRLAPEFQLKQGVAEDGTPLQTVAPETGARFLDRSEIDTLLFPSETYKIYRYLDLKELGFPRLLARKVFPYDEKHRDAEARYGAPPEEMDWLYSFDANRFIPLTPPEREKGEGAPLKLPPDFPFEDRTEDKRPPFGSFIDSFKDILPAQP